jgi:formylglycine-generating enzyme required for sulfatase activity
VLNSDPPPLASAAPGIDPGFAAVVERCLRRDPAERFASGDEVREALEALAVGAKTAARALARPSRGRRPSRSRRAIVAGVVLAFALVLFTYYPFGGEHAAETGSCPEGMVPVPAGTFRMGSPEGQGEPNEQPQHAVTLPSYCIDTTEVTVAAYAACVAANACRVAPRTVNWNRYSVENGKLYSGWCNHEERPDHPINCVDWFQAAAYCTWKGKRLPTEAEWEYAARGSDDRAYPWGQEAPNAKRLNACDSECVAMAMRHGIGWPAMYDGNDGWGTTAPVGSYPEGRSPFGALDMAGNVWEWTADRYGAYPTQAETNPQGPSTGTSRVLRGGGWVTQDADKTRAAFRIWNTPAVRDVDLGFRCARGD